MTDLRKLSEAAERAGAPVNATLATNTTDALSIETLTACDEAVDAFNVALRQAFRSGSLIPRSEYERVLALLAEAREALRMVSSGLNNAFAAGAEEREYGSARRQEKAMEKVEATRAAARATLSRIDDALAAEPEAKA